jgi:hypothetical protein
MWMGRKNMIFNHPPPPPPKNEDRKINQSIKKRIKKQATSKTMNNFFKNGYMSLHSGR